MQRFLKKQKQAGCGIELAFEISGQAGFIYDSLIDCVDQIQVVNPSKMTWIYRTSKKNDRLDARKMAVLLSIGETPAVYMPGREVRQWRQMILHRRKIINGRTKVKNRIRALLKSEGFRRPLYVGSWWKKVNRLWMARLCQKRAFEVVAFCLLPDHLHCLWRLPEGDNDFSQRWMLIKKGFTRRYLKAGGHESGQSLSRERKRERGIWQRRFWEHQIRDEEDLQKHVDYVHYNPVKHGLVHAVEDWPWSTYHRFVRDGFYEHKTLNDCDGNFGEDFAGE